MVAAAPLAAQAGGHPHVAPLAPGFSLLGTPGKVSPMMNEPDGIWNMGESTEGADIGGALGADPIDPDTSTPTFVPLLGAGGWNDHVADPANMEHYVGSFRRPAGAPVPDDETRASFEVVTQKPMGPETIVVVALFTQPTFGPEPYAQFAPFAPHDYPGDPNYHVPDKIARLVREDAAWAELGEKEPTWHRLDFHALRGSFATLLATSGVHPRVAQELLRHADIRLTMEIYTAVGDEQLRAAVGMLPSPAGGGAGAKRPSGGATRREAGAAEGRPPEPQLVSERWPPATAAWRKTGPLKLAPGCRERGCVDLAR